MSNTSLSKDILKSIYEVGISKNIFTGMNTCSIYYLSVYN